MSTSRVPPVAVPPSHQQNSTGEADVRWSGGASCRRAIAVASLSVLALAGCSSSSDRSGSQAQARPLLDTAGSFAVLAGQTVTNTGPTTVSGDLGVSPGSAVTGFPPGLVSNGATHAADAVALLAQNDLTTTYGVLAGMACDFDLTGLDLAGRTLVPGVYCFSSSALLSGALTLDAQGSPDALFVFQIGSTLTTASNASVAVVGGGQSCNVFWQIGSSATIGTGTTFVGNLVALTSISLATGASVSGRALARNGSVTLDTNRVSAASCSTCAGTVCGGACVDTGTDAANCGTCGHACASSESCSGGLCRAAGCPGAMCGGACVDTNTDNANCGTCGIVCAADMPCAAGICFCEPVVP